MGHEKWGNSPLWIRGKEGTWFITIGDHKISKNFETKEEIEAILPHGDTVNIMLNAAIATVEKWLELEIKRMNNDNTVDENGE